MKNMTLGNIAAACGGVFHGTKEQEAIEITGAELDSRKILPGNLFFATRGERVDGHTFVQKAKDLGAVCAVCEESADPYLTEAGSLPYIQVESSFQALKDIAGFYRDQLSIPIVGITGSVGKTSTKEAIASVLAAKFCVHKTAGNFNNEVGMPLTLLGIREEHEVAVVEMGISDFGEMDRLSSIAKPDLCVITNVGPCHLENLKSLEGVLKAKTEIFRHRNKKGPIVLNGNDPHLQTVLDVDGTKPLHFGLTEDCDVYGRLVKDLGLKGSDFELSICGEKVLAHCDLPGSHVVANSACAALVGHVLGLSNEEILRGIASQKPVPGRSYLIQSENLVIVDDCYNANPVSMMEAVDLLAATQGHRVAIFGDMFELGEDEKVLHAKVGAYAAKRKVDTILLSGQLSRCMYDAILEADAGYEEDASAEYVVRYYEKTDRLIADLSKVIRPQDVCLVKASHGMHYETIVSALKEL